MQVPQSYALQIRYTRCLWNIFLLSKISLPDLDNYFASVITKVYTGPKKAKNRRTPFTLTIALLCDMTLYISVEYLSGMLLEVTSPEMVLSIIYQACPANEHFL